MIKLLPNLNTAQTCFQNHSMPPYAQYQCQLSSPACADSFFPSYQASTISKKNQGPTNGPLGSLLPHKCSCVSTAVQQHQQPGSHIRPLWTCTGVPNCRQ